MYPIFEAMMFVDKNENVSVLRRGMLNHVDGSGMMTAKYFEMSQQNI